MAETPHPIELPVDRLLVEGAATAGGVPEGLDALLLAVLARKAGRPILDVARDGQRLATLEAALAFFAPDVFRLGFPAWHPGDRVRVWLDGPVNALAADQEPSRAGTAR